MILKYFKQGQEAYADNVDNGANPYLPTSEPHVSWESGYMHAWYEDTINNKDNND